MDGNGSDSYRASGFGIHKAQTRFQLPESLFILRCHWTMTSKGWSRCCTEWRWWLSFLEGPIHSFLFCLLSPPVSYLYTLAELEGRETE